jgi:hypothetical protein
MEVSYLCIFNYTFEPLHRLQLNLHI